MSDLDEAELRVELAALANEVAPTNDLLDRVVTGYRRRRRARCTMLAAAAAGAAALVPFLALRGSSTASLTPAGPDGSRPSSVPIASLRAPFTEFCLSFQHVLAHDAASAVSLRPPLVPGFAMYAQQAPCDRGLSTAHLAAIGSIRIVFAGALTVSEREHATAALSTSYPDASIVSANLPGTAVAFTVTPRSGSSLSRFADSGSLGAALDRVLGRILVMWGTLPLSDGREVEVQYAGPRLSPDQITQVRNALAAAAGVSSDAVQLLPYHPLR